jgi:hypothetical protein
MPAPTQTKVPDDHSTPSWPEVFEPLRVVEDEWPELAPKLPPGDAAPPDERKPGECHGRAKRAPLAPMRRSTAMSEHDPPLRQSAGSSHPAVRPCDEPHLLMAIFRIAEIRLPGMFQPERKQLSQRGNCTEKGMKFSVFPALLIVTELKAKN